MLKQIVHAMWEELYYEGEKFLKERAENHLHNVESIAKAIYYIQHIDKEERAD